MEKNKSYDIVMSGVGGQGIVLASDILSEVLIRLGFDVKKSETHGMAQRGGVVTSFLRASEKVYSPSIPAGKVDILLSFEYLEGRRSLNFLKPKGDAIIAQTRLIPPSANLPGRSYPDSPYDDIDLSLWNIHFIDTDKALTELKNFKILNTLMMGSTSVLLDLDKNVFLDVILKKAPKGTQEINEKSFYKGMELVS